MSTVGTTNYNYVEKASPNNDEKSQQTTKVDFVEKKDNFSPTTKQKENKNLTAGVLGFIFPGWPQIFDGKVKKGIKFWLGTCIFNLAAITANFVCKLANASRNVVQMRANGLLQQIQQLSQLPPPLSLLSLTSFEKLAIKIERNYPKINKLIKNPHLRGLLAISVPLLLITGTAMRVLSAVDAYNEIKKKEK